MGSIVGVLPVKSEEVVRILGSLNTEALINLLDDISIMRKNGLPDEAMMATPEGYLKTPPLSQSGLFSHT